MTASVKSTYLPILLIVCFANFMATLDASIVNISLPSIARDFKVGTSEVSWVTIGYQLVMASTVLFFGRLGDMLGLKRVFLAGFVFFSIGSFTCGMAPRILVLILSRALQGLGGAMLFTAAYAIVPKFLPRDLTGWGYSLVTAAATLGLTVGAPLGGFITGYYSWHWIFLINVPLGALAVIFAWRIIPSENLTPAPDAWSRFDYLGAALSLLTLVTLLYGLSMGEVDGWTSPRILGCFAVAAAGVVAFFLRESRCAEPLLDLGMLAQRNFLLGNLANFTAFMLLVGSNFILPFYLEFGLGFSTQKAGVFLMIGSVTSVVAGFAVGQIADKLSARLICTVSMAVVAASFALFVCTVSRLEVVWVSLYLFGLASGLGFFMAPNNKVVMSLAPSGRQGSASAVLRTLSNLGNMMGVCVFEIVFSHGLPANALAAAHGRTSQAAQMMPGWRHVYLLGCAIALISLALAAATREGVYRHEAGGEPAGMA